MEIFIICLVVFSLIFLSGIIIYLIYQHNQQCDKINSLQEELKKKQELDISEKQRLQCSILDLATELDDLGNEYAALANQKKQAETEVKKALDYKRTAEDAAHFYMETLDNEYAKKESDFDKYILNLQVQKKQAESDLNKIRASLAAGVEAQLREEEKKKKLDFYKITLSENELNDINLLFNLRSSFRNVTVLNKLIWSEYLQKKVSEMSARVVGKTDKTGIYKITNLKTQQYYIGQSVSIGERFKQHCKCGCGIGASASNKLYASMQQDGIWNFTFEVLEECPRDQLNEKEKLWIELYQSNIYGMNSTKGGS